MKSFRRFHEKKFWSNCIVTKSYVTWQLNDQKYGTKRVFIIAVEPYRLFFSIFDILYEEEAIAPHLECTFRVVYRSLWPARVIEHKKWTY